MIIGEDAPTVLKEKTKNYKEKSMESEGFDQSENHKFELYRLDVDTLEEVAL